MEINTIQQNNLHQLDDKSTLIDANLLDEVIKAILMLIVFFYKNNNFLGSWKSWFWRIFKWRWWAGLLQVWLWWRNEENQSSWRSYKFT